LRYPASRKFFRGFCNPANHKNFLDGSDASNLTALTPVEIAFFFKLAHNKFFLSHVSGIGIYKNSHNMIINDGSCSYDAIIFFQNDGPPFCGTF